MCTAHTKYLLAAIGKSEQWHMCNFLYKPLHQRSMMKNFVRVSITRMAFLKWLFNVAKV